MASIRRRYIPHPPVYVRTVLPATLVSEVQYIRSLLPRFPFAAIDTAFPGTVHGSAGGKPYHLLTADDNYATMKANVDELHVIQLGLTLCDAYGRLPVVPGPSGKLVAIVWQFDFNDFDVRHDRHAPESLRFLRAQGVDLVLTREVGVSSRTFAQELHSSGVVSPDMGITWVAFGGMHDFGYMLKALTGGKPLPETREGFLDELKGYFGSYIFDVKYMAKRYCPDIMRGGLKNIAGKLGVPPLLPELHQVGRVSLLTSKAFMAMRRLYFPSDGGARHAGHIDGLV